MQTQPIKFYEEGVSAYDIIKTKVIDHSEIVVNFFDYCNMRCSFCTQDHESKQGATREEILSKVAPILSYVKRNPSKNFLLHLMGGELFQDELINNGFLEHYASFINQLETQREDKTLQYNFITNLVFTEREKVKQFLDAFELNIAISYDPRARFSPTQLELFKENVEYFKPYIRIVSSVMTKQNMEAIINGDDYFDYLYSNFDIHWDHMLVGDDRLDMMMPTEEQTKLFYIHLVDNYPKCLNLQQFFEKTKPLKMGCTRGNSFTIFADNSVPLGCSGSVVLKNAKTEDNWSSKIVHKFLDDKMCLSCEYFQRCHLTCFVHNDYAKLVKDPQGCPYKQVFDYVESKR